MILVLSIDRYQLILPQINQYRYWYQYAHWNQNYSVAGCSCSHLRFNTDANDFWLKPEISQQALGLTRLLILMMMMMIKVTQCLWSRIRDRVLDWLWSRQPIERAEIMSALADAGLTKRRPVRRRYAGDVSSLPCSVNDGPLNCRPYLVVKRRRRAGRRPGDWPSLIWVFTYRKKFVFVFLLLHYF